MRPALAALALLAVTGCAALPLVERPATREVADSTPPARDRAADDALIACALADADAYLKEPSPPPPSDPIAAEQAREVQEVARTKQINRRCWSEVMGATYAEIGFVTFPRYMRAWNLCDQYSGRQ